MQRYIFVLAYEDADGDTAFAHTYVRTGEGKDTAQLLGERWANRDMVQFKGKFLNNYLVPLET